MSKMINIVCKNTSKNYEIAMGTSLLDFKKMIFPNDEKTIVAALVNNNLEELDYMIFKSKTIEFIDISSLDGYSIYIRSIIFVLYKAIKNIFPNAELVVKNFISNGIYCNIYGCDLHYNNVCDIRNEMYKIICADYPILNTDYPTEEAISIYEEQGFKDKRDLFEARGKIYTSVYTIDGTAAYFYGILTPSTGYLKTFDIEKYEDGIIIRLADRNNCDKLLPIIPQKKLFCVFKEYKTWIKVLEVPNIAKLNTISDQKKHGDLIKINEAMHEKKISDIADIIKSQNGRIKIVLIAGPSSSGKTTFGKRLNIQLQVNGIKPINLSLDNYFVNREHTPKDEKGEYDYETIDALDVDTLNDNIIRLIQGEKVEIPKFSFEKGERFYDGEYLEIGERNIIIIEGIHGLNPSLTKLLPQESIYKIFVSALTTIAIDAHNIISPKDNRLIRRMVRDYKYRGYSAVETLKRWESVTEGEEIHIVPYQEEADIIFNSALIYELGTLKQQAENILREVSPINNEYSKAQRLLKFFSYIKNIPIWEIPPTSILREFLGGSSFNY